MQNWLKAVLGWHRMRITKVTEMLGRRKVRWNNTFDSDDGKYIIKALYSFCNIDGTGLKCDDLSVAQGRRDVFNYIINQMNFDVEDYINVYKEKKNDRRIN